MILVVVGLLHCVPVVEGAKKRSHHYEIEDEVPFYVNKIGPYSNPSETYEFYSLPFCQPSSIQHKHTKIGEDLTGDHKVNSLYDLRFRVPIHFARLLCKVHLTGDETDEFIDAIKDYYYFEMLYDDLPIRGFIGTVDRELRNGEEVEHYYLFKHLHFHVLYNNDQIIYANATADPHRLVELIPSEEVMFEFTYSVSWEEVDYPFKDRMKLYEENFFSKELEIHWLSIMNSCVLVLLLTGFLVIIIMRILKSDYNRYARAEDEEEDQEDYGWKLIHGDVFRFPPFKNLFTSFLGIGSQCIAMLFSLLILAIFGMFYPNNPGTMYTAGIILYALTSVIGGFVSASYFKQMGGEKWAWNIVLVAALFVGPVLVVFAFLNTVAITYNATAAVPFSTIMIIVAILTFIGFPLTIIGGIAGKRSSGAFEAPCRTKNFPREIPPIPWYRSLPMQMIMAGFLPFSAIYIELFYIYSSVWGHSSYQLFGILFIVAIILFIVTACITIALTYFQLSMEDHRWWWSSFLNGGSTGIFVYLYPFSITPIAPRCLEPCKPPSTLDTWLLCATSSSSCLAL
jgi:MFS family permease